MITLRRTDLILLIATLLLLALGLAMVYSTSAVVAQKRYGDSLFFFKRQMVWAGLGLLAMWGARSLPYRLQRRLALPVVVCTLIGLILVLVPGLGKEVAGASRWLVLGPLTLQPSEGAKYVLVLYVASRLAERPQSPPHPMAVYLPHVFLLGVVCLLIFLQPDLGTAVVLAMAVGLLFLIAGLPWRYLGYSVLIGLPLLYWGLVHKAYRLQRLVAFLDPWADSQGGGYQAVQSLLALGQGGLFGIGLGQSQQKLFYLPEAHTDFIFAVIGEELGFIGASGLVLLFLVLLWRILHIALACREPFGALLGVGIFLMLTLQIMVNLGVVVGILPTKGLPLPLISLGGSNLLVSLVAIGTVLNIVQENP